MLSKGFLPGTLPDDPMPLFAEWFDGARAAKAQPNPDSMALATTTTDGRPSVRIVLCKKLVLDPGYAVFFTNYDSRKGRELAANPQAALLFFWPELERQIRIEGRVERISAAESDAYYRSRPLASRIGAWASPQSEPIPSKAWLMGRAAEMGLRHGLNPDRPPHWGGYRLRHAVMEFWQGRPSRLHDRLRYRRVDSGWERTRLAP